MIYYDNAATTMPFKEAIEAADRSLQTFDGNPSSLHRLGTQAAGSINAARRKVAAALACKEKEIVFTSCATESINTVLKGFRDAYPRLGLNIVTSAAEHKATLECCAYLEKQGAKVTYLMPGIDGSISNEQLSNACDTGTSLITFLHVNNETGAISDLQSIVRIRNLQCPDARIHIDAVQSFTKIPFHPSRTGIDFASFSAHKINGLKGVGAIFVSEKGRIAPLLHGGGQEHSLRSGTENVPAIAGFGAAAEISSTGLPMNLERTALIRNTFIQNLTDRGIVFIVNSPENGSPYILNLSFPGVMPEVLLHALEADALYISTASACSSKNARTSYVLKSMGIREETAKYAVRLSFGVGNTTEEAVRAAEIFYNALLRIPRKK
ncbi:MAG: cysteine desulfurase family protein [Saccharofermentanales bacterium]